MLATDPQIFAKNSMVYTDNSHPSRPDANPDANQPKPDEGWVQTSSFLQTLLWFAQTTGTPPNLTQTNANRRKPT